MSESSALVSVFELPPGSQNYCCRWFIGTATSVVVRVPGWHKYTKKVVIAREPQNTANNGTRRQIFGYVIVVFPSGLQRKIGRYYIL